MEPYIGRALDCFARLSYCNSLDCRSRPPNPNPHWFYCGSIFGIGDSATQPKQRTWPAEMHRNLKRRVLWVRGALLHLEHPTMLEEGSFSRGSANKLIPDHFKNIGLKHMRTVGLEKGTYFRLRGMGGEQFSGAPCNKRQSHCGLCRVTRKSTSYFIYA